MADGRWWRPGAVTRCLTLRAPCGASGTRYVSMGGLIGSRRARQRRTHTGRHPHSESECVPPLVARASHTRATFASLVL
eukprot:2522794-Prymnesium_polylepis.1